MKKLATKLSPKIKVWIKEEFGTDTYDNEGGDKLFHFPNYDNSEGFKYGFHSWVCLEDEYTEVSESEFLEEFGKEVEYQIFLCGKWTDTKHLIRIKPTPDYSKEIEALQEKAKENGMSVTFKFEKL